MTVRIARDVARLAVSLVLTSSAVVVAACGGSDGSLFDGSPSAGASDAGAPPPVTYDAGGVFNTDDGEGTGDAGDASAPQCAPVPLTSAFQATWDAPKPFGEAACTTNQLGEFYKSCLTPPIDSAACDKFKQANGTCATCIESDESDAHLGPVIWHSHRTFFTLNVAGCIANAQQDVSPKGCGAAYQGVLECKQAACESCFATPGSTFAQFATCEKASGTTVCRPYADAMHDACGDDLHDAGNAAAVCFPPTGATSRQVYDLLAPLFCGAK